MERGGREIPCDSLESMRHNPGFMEIFFGEGTPDVSYNLLIITGKGDNEPTVQFHVAPHESHPQLQIESGEVIREDTVQRMMEVRTNRGFFRYDWRPDPAQEAGRVLIRLQRFYQMVIHPRIPAAIALLSRCMSRQSDDGELGGG